MGMGFSVKQLLRLVHVLLATDCWEFTVPNDAYGYAGSPGACNFKDEFAVGGFNR